MTTKNDNCEKVAKQLFEEMLDLLKTSKAGTHECEFYWDVLRSCKDYLQHVCE